MTEQDAAGIWKRATGTDADTVLRLPTGACNYVFLVGAEGRKRVLRIAAKENAAILNGSLYWIERLGVLDLPIPRVLAADLRNDPPYAILSYIEGRDLGLVYDGLSEDEKREIAKGVMRAQDAIAGLPRAEGYGFLSSYEDPGKKATWQAVVEGQLARSRARIATNGIFDTGYVDRVMALLSHHEAYFSTIRPVPFFDDATTKNVLVRDGRLSGIVDLDWICFGDRLYAVALTRMSLLNAKSSTSYIDYLLADEPMTAQRSAALDFYTLGFCVDFMGEAGMRFNKDASPEVSPETKADLERLFETLMSERR